MYIGGYTILDFKGQDVAAPKTIPGIHDRIESSINKPTIVTGVVATRVELPAAPVTFRVVGGDFVGMYSFVLTDPTTVKIATIKVTAEDQVTFTESEAHIA